MSVSQFIGQLFRKFRPSSAPVKHSVSELNEKFRQYLTLGDLEILGDDNFNVAQKSALLTAVRRSVPSDCAQSRGTVVFEGARYCWEIEAYNKDFVFSAFSDDPTDPDVTTRVLLLDIPSRSH